MMIQSHCIVTDSEVDEIQKSVNVCKASFQEPTESLKIT